MFYVAEKIRTIRESQKWSQEEFADRAGLSRSTLYRIESGKPFPLDVFFRILDAFELSADQLLPQDMQRASAMPQNFYNLNDTNQKIVTQTISTLINSLLMAQ